MVGFIAMTKKEKNAAKAVEKQRLEEEKRVEAYEAKLLAPPTKVRLLTPPKVPDSENEDATDALRGSTSVAPEEMVMEAVCEVNSSRDVYAHKLGSTGRVVLAALVSEATKLPAAATPSTLVTPIPQPVQP